MDIQSILATVSADNASTLFEGKQPPFELNALASSWLGQQSSASGNDVAAITAGNGYNMSLADPLSGYNMMSQINQAQVNYEAQYAELSGMASGTSSLQTAAQNFSSAIASDSSSGNVTQQLQSFIDQYNSWVNKYAPDMQSKGILAGTQAAQVARTELAEAVDNPFYGAAQGLHGLKSLGVSIDDNTGLATLDSNQLAQSLQQNPSGTLTALNSMTSNFAKSAELLDSPNNFYDNQLTNLNTAIGFISSHEASWQQEFGTGAAPDTSGQIAQALAAYKKMQQS